MHYDLTAVFYISCVYVFQSTASLLSYSTIIITYMYKVVIVDLFGFRKKKNEFKSLKYTLFLI